MLTPRKGIICLDMYKPVHTIWPTQIIKLGKGMHWLVATYWQVGFPSTTSHVVELPHCPLSASYTLHRSVLVSGLDVSTVTERFNYTVSLFENNNNRVQLVAFLQLNLCFDDVYVTSFFRLTSALYNRTRQLTDMLALLKHTQDLAKHTF